MIKTQDPMANIPGIGEARKVFRPLLNNDTFNERASYLWSRWQDEKGYEDFKEYVKAMRTSLAEINPRIELVQMDKRPMMLHMKHPSCPAVTFRMKITGRGLSLTSHTTRVMSPA